MAVMGASPALQAHLPALLERGRHAWPGLEVSGAALGAHLAARLEEAAQGGLSVQEEGLEEALRALDVESLYLTCACLGAVPGALLRFEQRFFPEVDGALSRFAKEPGIGEEVKQRLRNKLFVAAAGEEPKIARYTGRGDLGRWLKVAATREALAILRQTRREVLSEDHALADFVTSGEDEELAYLKKEYRAEFKRAFQEAFEGLGPRQRTILRYNVLDALNIDEIGAIYGVHRATVARWIERTRFDLLERTREALMARIQVNRAEFESIMRLIQSELEVSLPRLLRDKPGDRPDG